MVMNFADALNTRSSEIERPPLIPVGTYLARVKAIPTMDSVGDNKWDVLDFQLLLQNAGEDVDQDDLTQYGGLGPQSVVRHRFMFNKEDDAAFKRTLFNLKRFLLDHLQVEGGDDSALKELLDGAVGHTCNVFIRWRPDKNDPEVQYNEIGKTAPAE